ncbi:MAG TPA: ROK family protein [Devosia sp.]|nr:ROK family protein [Devosia sp.]
MILCIDIGGSAIKSAIATGPEMITPIGRIATPLDDRAAFDAAIGAVLAQVPEARAVSISITGVVDPRDGRIKVANIPCIDGRTLAADLMAQLGRPVLVANDADCFALAEAVAGAGRGEPIVFGVILGTGVGGGLVVDGRIVNGAGGFAGEWGHGPVAATSAGHPPVSIPRFACGCGQVGCVDTIGAARGIERLHQHVHGIGATSTEIIAGWEAGDAKAARTVDVWVDLVASPLALVLNVVGASVVPVGGGLSNAPALIGLLDRTVRQRILRRTDAPLVVPGQCRVEPGLIGAAILGLRAA